MRLESRDFTDTVQLEFAIRDIRRYQEAYLKANNADGIMVKWKKGWFAIYRGQYPSFYRKTEFRNMTDVLEKRVKSKESK